MKNIKSKIILLLIVNSILISSSFLISSCEGFATDVDPKKIPQNESKLVINLYLSPQDTIISARVQNTAVKFSSTNTFNQNIGEINTDSKLFLSDGTKEIQLKYNLITELYSSNNKEMKIIPGKKYNLRAVDKKNQTYTSETIIPNSTDFKYEITDLRKFDYGLNFNISLSWNAPPISYFSFSEIKILPSNNNSQILQKSYNIGYEANLLNNNKTIFSKLENFYSTNLVRIDPNAKNDNIGIVYLLTLDENYYKYHKSIDNANRIGDNPFAEPVLIYSNIKNGFGCFGSYNAVNKEYKIQ